MFKSRRRIDEIFPAEVDEDIEEHHRTQNIKQRAEIIFHHFSYHYHVNKLEELISDAQKSVENGKLSVSFSDFLPLQRKG